MARRGSGAGPRVSARTQAARRFRAWQPVGSPLDDALRHLGGMVGAVLLYHPQYRFWAVPQGPAIQWRRSLVDLIRATAVPT